MSSNASERELSASWPLEVRQLGTPLSAHPTRRARLFANLAFHLVLECGLGGLLLFGCIASLLETRGANFRWYEALP